jgi:hypothetical protein
VLERGLLPRLSIGTLQLSIRCSSIHFLPMRSFPVSDGPLVGTAVAAFGAVWSGCLSCAKASDAKHIAKRKLIKPRRIGSSGVLTKSFWRQIKHAEIHVATRNLQTTSRLPLITSCVLHENRRDR